MIDADTLSDYNNEIDSGTYINRLRIRYILHNKLDAYGVNQQRITGSTNSGINYLSANLDEVHVYEDTYLIAVNFTNVTPEIRIIDVEGEIRTEVPESWFDLIEKMLLYNFNKRIDAQ